MAVSDMAVAAGELALKSSGGADVDTVVLATTSPDRPCPATAPDVATRLGQWNIAAFDVNAVCSGFVYALAVGAGMVTAGTAERVLVIGADAFTSYLDPEDRSSTIIFGDGAGAVVLRAGEATELGALGPFDLGSDGSGADLLTVKAGGSRQRLSAGVPEAMYPYFTMSGKEVFWRAVQRMAASAQAALDRAGWQVGDIDRLVSHQANQRITKQLAGELGVPPERAVSNIAEVGNTVAASIPLALHQAHTEGTLAPGDRVLLTAFGAGLTWASVTLRWPRFQDGADQGGAR
jgi:3-oxoacyl-[acyl-carrier-protein] synthase-3